MGVLWNDLIPWWSLPVPWRWSLGKAIQHCKFLAGRKHFTVDAEVLVQTSHPFLQRTNHWSETYKLLAIRASVFIEPLCPAVLWIIDGVDEIWNSSRFYFHWSSPGDHLVAVETCLTCRFSGPGPHTAVRRDWLASSSPNYDWFRDNRINIGEVAKVWNVDSFKREKFLFTQLSIVFSCHKPLSGSQWNKREKKNKDD